MLQFKGLATIPGCNATLSVSHAVMETVVMDSTVTFIFTSILQHPNVLQCVGQCVEAIPYLLVFEFCDLVSSSRDPAEVWEGYVQMLLTDMGNWCWL